MNRVVRRRQHLAFALLFIVSSLLAILGYRGMHRDLILARKGDHTFNSSIPSSPAPEPESSPPQLSKLVIPPETPLTQSSRIAVTNQTRIKKHTNQSVVVPKQEIQESVSRGSEQRPFTKHDDETELQRAETFMIRKEYAQAEKIYKKYLEQHSNDLKIRLKLAELLSWGKKYDDSLVEYERILKVRPDDKQVRRKYSNVLIWSGKIDEAENELRKTLE